MILYQGNQICLTWLIFQYTIQCIVLFLEPILDVENLLSFLSLNAPPHTPSMGGINTSKILTPLSLAGQVRRQQVRRTGPGQPHPHWYRHDARDADESVSERDRPYFPSFWSYNWFTFSESEPIPFPLSQSWWVELHNNKVRLKGKNIL